MGFYFWSIFYLFHLIRLFFIIFLKVDLDPQKINAVPHPWFGSPGSYSYSCSIFKFKRRRRIRVRRPSLKWHRPNSLHHHPRSEISSADPEVIAPMTLPPILKWAKICHQPRAQPKSLVDRSSLNPSNSSRWAAVIRLDPHNPTWINNSRQNSRRPRRRRGKAPRWRPSSIWRPRPPSARTRDRVSLHLFSNAKTWNENCMVV